MFGQIFPKAVLFLALALLVACDSAEERAEKHFQSALSLLEEGDVPRAILEFRNVFALDEFHRDARAEYARVVREQGNITESYAQFLRIVEQDPNDIEARLALAQMAVLRQNWGEVERHGTVLTQMEIPPQGADVIDLSLRFRRAVEDEDSALIRQLTAEAKTLLRTSPDDPILNRLTIEGHTRTGDMDAALASLNAAIELIVRIRPDFRGIICFDAA